MRKLFCRLCWLSLITALLGSCGASKTPANSPWHEAYYNFIVNEYRNTHSGYRFRLLDFNQDGVPELELVNYGTYTYSQGEVKRIDFSGVYDHYGEDLGGPGDVCGYLNRKSGEIHWFADYDERHRMGSAHKIEVLFDFERLTAAQSILFGHTYGDQGEYDGFYRGNDKRFAALAEYQALKWEWEQTYQPIKTLHDAHRSDWHSTENDANILSVLHAWQPIALPKIKSARTSPQITTEPATRSQLLNETTTEPEGGW